MAQFHNVSHSHSHDLTTLLPWPVNGSRLVLPEADLDHTDEQTCSALQAIHKREGTGCMSIDSLSIKSFKAESFPSKTSNYFS